LNVYGGIDATSHSTGSGLNTTTRSPPHSALEAIDDEEEDDVGYNIYAVDDAIVDHNTINYVEPLDDANGLYIQIES